MYQISETNIGRKVPVLNPFATIGEAVETFAQTICSVIDFEDDTANDAADFFAANGCTYVVERVA